MERADAPDAPEEHSAGAGDRVVELSARADDPEDLRADPGRVAAGGRLELPERGGVHRERLDVELELVLPARERRVERVGTLRERALRRDDAAESVGVHSPPDASHPARPSRGPTARAPRPGPPLRGRAGTGASPARSPAEVGDRRSVRATLSGHALPALDARAPLAPLPRGAGGGPPGGGARGRLPGLDARKLPRPRVRATGRGRDRRRRRRPGAAARAGGQAALPRPRHGRG